MYPISPFGPLAHAGPITRTVEDAAMLLDIIALPDHRDPTSLAPTLTTYRGEVRRDVVGLGVAYSPNLGYADVDPQIEAAVGAAVRALADAGLNVTEADPGFADPIDAFEVLWATGSRAACVVTRRTVGSSTRAWPRCGNAARRPRRSTTWPHVRSVSTWVWSWGASTSATTC